jgi:hypothetical protein
MSTIQTWILPSRHLRFERELVDVDRTSQCQGRTGRRNLSSGGVRSPDKVLEARLRFPTIGNEDSCQIQEKTHVNCRRDLAPDLPCPSCEEFL